VLRGKREHEADKSGESKAMTEIERLREENEKLREFVRSCAISFDCDADAHKYGTFCRACEAKKLLEGV
jgi:hypothetical protein